MNTTPKDGGPAFPITHANNTHAIGMSLRDHFASEALPSIIAEAFRQEWSGKWRDNVAGECYLFADAMLAARLNGHVSEPAKPACDSEAVALVRKLHKQLSARHHGTEYAWNDVRDLLTEAEAFLAREGK